MNNGDYMGKGYGYGKAILFGEHFVVYGLPAIASALGSSTEAVVVSENGSGWSIDDRRPATPGYKKQKFDEAQQAIANVINYLSIDTEKQKLNLSFAGDLFVASGVGASAAQCASLARALNDEFNLGMNDDKINDAAYEGEKAYHGTPSGIDNTAATFGGLIWFVKNIAGGSNTMDRLQAANKMLLVIANTGITASTTEVVEDVKILKEKYPKKFQAIFSKYESIVNEAKKALIEGDIIKLGELMNRNHALLQDINVSGDVNNKIVNIALENNALGAKMTGTGRGGLVIALAKDMASQDDIAEKIENAGYTVWKTTIG